jgi:hypothetical protein
VLPSVALGDHMSSKIGEEMLFQNKLHQCLGNVKEIFV